jgi:hypothetical protein
LLLTESNSSARTTTSISLPRPRYSASNSVFMPQRRYFFSRSRDHSYTFADASRRESSRSLLSFVATAQSQTAQALLKAAFQCIHS